MKFILVLFFAMLAVAASQRRRIHHRLPVYPPYPVHQFGDEEYAASLGGAPVGHYGKHDGRGGFGRGGFGRGYSEVSGISLGGAKVGLYGKDRPRNRLPLLG